MHHYAVLLVEIVALLMLVIVLKARLRLSWSDGLVGMVLLVVVIYISTLIFPAIKREVAEAEKMLEDEAVSMASISEKKSNPPQASPIKTVKKTSEPAKVSRPIKENSESTSLVHKIENVSDAVYAEAAGHFWTSPKGKTVPAAMTNVPAKIPASKPVVFVAPPATNDFWSSPINVVKAPVTVPIPPKEGWASELKQAIADEREGKYDQAQTRLEKALQEGGENQPRVHFYLGVVHNKKEDLERAIKNYTTAISLDKTFTSAWYNRATSYYLLKQYQKAADDYSKVIELNPKSATAWEFRGRALLQLGQDERGNADLEEAARLNKASDNE